MRIPNWVRYLSAVALVWAMGNLPSPATAKDADDNKPAAGGVAAKEKKPASKDPVASAFLLPKGTTLNAKQQAAYDQLKADKEDELRQAIDDLQNSKSGATAAAAKKVRDLRTSIRQKMYDILYGKLAASGDSGSNSGGRNSEGYAPYGAPAYYGGYYPNWPYGYNPYPYYNSRWLDARYKNSSGGPNGKSPGKSSPPPRPPVNSSSGGGGKR